LTLVGRLVPDSQRDLAFLRRKRNETHKKKRKTKSIIDQEMMGENGGPIRPGHEVWKKGKDSFP